MELNRIGRPHLGSAFARVFGVDDLAAVATLAPEVMPTSSLWERPEFWALLGGNLCMVRNEAAAGGAGTFGYLGLANPGSSGTLFIVEKVITEGVAAQLLIGSSSLSGATAEVTITHRDLRRVVGTNFSSGINCEAYIGVNSGLTVNGRCPTNTVLPLDIIIPPGGGFALQSITANVAFAATIIGRERVVMPDELDV